MNLKLFNCLFGVLIAYSNFGLSHSDGKALDAVTKGLNHFSNAFYKIASHEKNENLICSPLSVDIVLAMTSYGARGKTQKEMHSVLHIPSDDIIQKGYEMLIAQLHSVRKIELQLAQKIFIDEKLTVKPTFNHVIQTYFKSSSQRVNFNKPTEASHIINKWCEIQTRYHIKNLIQPGDLDRALIVLVNAVYFKGNWLYKFDPSKTHNRPFHTDKNTKNVATMYQMAKFNYGTLPKLDAVFVELPYESESKADSMSMFIILPNQKNGLAKATSKLDTVNFQHLHNQHHMTPIKLYMPKFKIESTLDLQSVLEKMGMRTMFTDRANFEGITGDRMLKISKVVQKAFIEVNEKGSKAAAATGVIGGPKSGTSPPRLLTLMINRPFFYTIVHIPTNVPLFQGHINMPKY